MNILKRVWQWLFTKHQKENTVTDTTATDTAATTDTASDSTSTEDTATTTATDTTGTATTTTTVTTDDSVLDQVKELLVKIGHDVESEWDEVVALAKKLVTKSSS